LTACTKTRLLARSAETPTVVRWAHPRRNPSLPREAWRTKLTDIIFAFQESWEHESSCGRDACRMVNRINRWSGRTNSIVSVLAVSVVLIAGCSGSVAGSKSVLPIVGTITSNSATISFSPTQVGATATQNVTLSVSGAPITVISAQVSGAGFTLASPMLPSTLSSGQSLALTIQFAPQTVGQLSGSLVIASNASNPTLTIALSGSGTAAPARSATVSWASGDPAAVAYLVFRSDVSGGPYVPLTTSLLTELSYTDSTVSSGSTYFYVVTELDAAGDESPFSSEVLATVP